MQTDNPFHILLVDDDDLVHLTAKMEYEKYSDLVFKSVLSGEEAVVEIQSNPNKYAVILLDFQMGNGMDGGDTAKEILKVNPDQYIFIYSADDSREALKKTFKSGVIDFLEKTIPTEEKISRVREYCDKFRKYQESISPIAISKRNRELLEKVEMIGQSSKMYKIAESIILSAKYDSNVLIQGETGTGKELVARAIHSNSNRQHRPFVAINCGAIAENLIESELFGHKRGSFTGAIADKKGKFQEAEGGTIFLDEIGDMPLNVQVKLLRVLQEGEIEPIGKMPLKINVRIVAATHVNLRKKIKDGSFREDLFFRLNVLGIALPPLRDRKEDIVPLLTHFIDKLIKETKFLTTGAIDKLKEYDWPGNIRQLKNAVERLRVATDGDHKIRPEHITRELLGTSTINDTQLGSIDNIDSIVHLENQIKDLEKCFWKDQLKKVPSVVELAKLSRISQATLYRKLGNLEINYKSI